jgi:hypothetical protein
MSGSDTDDTELNAVAPSTTKVLMYKDYRNRLHVSSAFCTRRAIMMWWGSLKERSLCRENGAGISDAQTWKFSDSSRLVGHPSDGRKEGRGGVSLVIFHSISVFLLFDKQFPLCHYRAFRSASKWLQDFRSKGDEAIDTWSGGGWRGARHVHGTGRASNYLCPLSFS